MPKEHNNEHLILVAGAETDGVNVYVKFDGENRLYRVEYISDAGFATDEEYEHEALANSKESWSKDLNRVLKDIRLPWHLFSFIRFSPSYAEQIAAIQRSICEKKGGEPIFLATSKKIRFLNDI